ncbi:hypothetical protein N5V81_13565 [Escherichia coli]|nr:hypothetical protein [Escherichia coli]
MVLSRVRGLHGQKPFSLMLYKEFPKSIITEQFCCQTFDPVAYSVEFLKHYHAILHLAGQKGKKVNMGVAIEHEFPSIEGLEYRVITHHYDPCVRREYAESYRTHGEDSGPNVVEDRKALSLLNDIDPSTLQDERRLYYRIFEVFSRDTVAPDAIVLCLDHGYMLEVIQHGSCFRRPS